MSLPDGSASGAELLGRSSNIMMMENSEAPSKQFVVDSYSSSPEPDKGSGILGVGNPADSIHLRTCHQVLLLYFSLFC